MKKTCKCFGYSGTCTQEACWLVLPSFNRVGLHLKQRFDSASKVSFDNKGTKFQVHDESMKPPTAEDLVYTLPSPTFCEPDPRVGSFGVKGRRCTATSLGTDGCDIMCCGREYKPRVEQSETSCDCVFHWCCSVKCRTCKIERTVHRCFWWSRAVVGYVITDRNRVGFERRELECLIGWWNIIESRMRAQGVRENKNAFRVV